MAEAAHIHRHRDKNGEISRKHGNTLIRTLRKTYGSAFAKGCGETETLRDVLHKLDEPLAGSRSRFARVMILIATRDAASPSRSFIPNWSRAFSKALDIRVKSAGSKC